MIPLVVLADAQTVSAQDYCSAPDAGPDCICTQQGIYYANNCALMGYAPNQIACCPIAPTMPDSVLGCWISVPAFLIQLGDGRCCVNDPYAGGYVLDDGTNRSCPLCGDRVIDPSTQCCVGDAPVQKHPILDLAQCPNRVPDPGHVPGFNGCGPEFLSGVQFLIPQGYNSASFTDSCNGHDICYDTCNSEKSTCDLNFGESMVQSCVETYQPIISAEDDPVLAQQFNAQFTFCKLAAFRFFNAVKYLGQSAFDSAQKDACDCCP